MVPQRVVFDRFAIMTQGLEAVANNNPLTLQINGVALVTGWLTSGIWQACYDAPVTVWTDC